MSIRIANLIKSFLIAYFCILAYQCNNTTVTKSDNIAFDWDSYLRKPYVGLAITMGSIYAIGMSDSITSISINNIAWSLIDSGMLNDSEWFDCKFEQRLSCAGTPIFYNLSENGVFPKYVIMNYSINSDTLEDTIFLVGAGNFMNSISAKQILIDSITYLDSVFWNLSLLGTLNYAYMTIAIDNGLFSAEYYESYPNYGNFPETSQPPEGYRTMYGRFKPEDNIFVINSIQQLLPFVILTNTIKQYPLYDMRIIYLASTR